MRHLDQEGRLSGILNGIDVDLFDPSTDPYISRHFSAQDPAGKACCREALFSEIGLEPQPGVPLIGTVTRVSSQKGLYLVADAAQRLFDIPVQLVIQGLGDPAIIGDLRKLQDENPGSIRFVERFDEDLAQRIYAGCDMFLMPSLFEPCGLGQMIAMRYGTIPVVRKTGGLADTVEDGTNGFSFVHRSADELCEAVERATRSFRKPREWRQLIGRAMAAEPSWSRSAGEYAGLYSRAIAAREGQMLKLA